MGRQARNVAVHEAKNNIDWAPKSDRMQGKIWNAGETGILRALRQTFKRRAAFRLRKGASKFRIPSVANLRTAEL